MADVADRGRFGVLRLSESSEVPVSSAAELGWHPVRHRLGISAFGMNAFTCHTAGGRLIEEHDELGDTAGGHEEVYVVMAGHAVFTLDGEEVDAPAGTIVAVHDPATRRGARALVAGTTALAVGGRPGLPFQVALWEYVFRADAEARAGRPAEGVAILSAALERWPEEPVVFYNLACFDALAGRPDDALAHLLRAVGLAAEYAGYAVDDRDLDTIMDRPGFPVPPAFRQ
jgi:hypothetical protein